MYQSLKSRSALRNKESMEIKFISRIKRDLENEIKWIENGKVRELDDAQISTILSIIEVELDLEDSPSLKE